LDTTDIIGGDRLTSGENFGLAQISGMTAGFCKYRSDAAPDRYLSIISSNSQLALIFVSRAIPKNKSLVTLVKYCKSIPMAHRRSKR
jgi:hypothetical protein